MWVEDWPSTHSGASAVTGHTVNMVGNDQRCAGKRLTTSSPDEERLVLSDSIS